ncbi:hypothetical protein ACQEVC_34270 [Plantactinospora sp. CA-294935]|uniref:hypothetical protein n=1 Tax=Plantactinospora sp. CA-294935 TaxID=3240012 RepID=UPI003D8C75D7
MTVPLTPVDEVAWPVAVALRTAVADELAAALGGKPATTAVVPGRDVAIDDCCNGQAWVRIVRVFPTDPGEFPQGRTTSVTEGCDQGAFWAVELGVGTARCAPSQDDFGNPPTAPDQERAAMVLADDAGRIRRAVMRRLPETATVEEVFVGEQTSVGPSGGCVGQELLVTVMTSVCIGDEG